MTRRVSMHFDWDNPRETGFVDFGTGFKNPNLAAMAEAVGIRGIRPQRPLAMPPAVRVEMATGFTLFMVKAVMSGRGDELVELSRTDLWR